MIYSLFSCRFPGQQRRSRRLRKNHETRRCSRDRDSCEWWFRRSSSPSGAASGSATWERFFRQKPASSPDRWFHNIWRNHLFREIFLWHTSSWYANLPTHLGFLSEEPILGRHASTDLPALRRLHSFWLKVVVVFKRKLKTLQQPSIADS